jgi:hypothetical protein
VIPLSRLRHHRQEDCNGSGNSAGSILARVLSETGKVAAIPLSRPVPGPQPLSDDEAVEHARSRGFGFVLNGEVDDYYNVAFGTFRSDRAGVWIRILRTSDGTVVAFASQKKEKGNYSSPDKIIEGLARNIRDGLRFDSSVQPASMQRSAEPKPVAVTTTKIQPTSEPVSGSAADGRGVFTNRVDAARRRGLRRRRVRGHHAHRGAWPRGGPARDRAPQEGAGRLEASAYRLGRVPCQGGWGVGARGPRATTAAVAGSPRPAGRRHSLG